MSFSIRGLLRRGPATEDARRLAEKLVDRGIAAEKSGGAARALEVFRKAVEADDRYGPAHMNLGIALQAAGQSAAAIAAYERAIALEPEYVVAHYNLGLAHLSRSRHAEAESAFRVALRLRDDFPEAWVGLADALEGLQRNEDALSALDKAVSLRSDYVGALVNSFTLLRKMGHRTQAVANAHRVLELEPDNYLAHGTLGISRHALGQLSEAEASYRQALTFNPDYTEAKSNLASLLQATGRAAEAIALLFEWVANEATNAHLRGRLAEALNGFALTKASEKERQVLVSLCADDNFLTFLVPSILELTKAEAGFRKLQSSAWRGEDPVTALVPAVEALLRDPLLLEALPRVPIADAAVEEVLTYLRRCMLLRFKWESGLGAVDSAVSAEFACALARQCFFSGYALFIADSERERVASLRRDVQDALREGVATPRALEPSLIIVSLYDSLHTLQGCERLLEHPLTDWSEAFRPLVYEQIENRAREREIASQIPSLTPIDDQISKAVRSQYEENPYPRWVAMQTPHVDTIEELSRRLRPDQEIRIRARPVPALIAGCGTGRQSISFALAYPDSEILAVDLSLASLSYAARMTEQRRIENITYRQADILKLGNLDRRFAVIECLGVLHHLDDPVAGWRILVNLLEPDGLMKIALYSKTARRGFQVAREFAELGRFAPTPDGIRHCRNAIMNLPDGHPAKSVLNNWDFFLLDGCRDLIMHVQEHQFTLPRIEACLDQLGLQFLAFECSEATWNRFRAMFPDREAETNLGAWHEFEKAHPDTFVGTYSFWTCRE